MAALSSNIKIEMELRPCIVFPYEHIKTDGAKALFHRWGEESRVIGPSPLRGGHSGGSVHFTVAIVEYEDGTVGKVSPECIRFLDSPHDQYEFIEREDTKQ